MTNPPPLEEGLGFISSQTTAASAKNLVEHLRHLVRLLVRLCTFSSRVLVTSKQELRKQTQCLQQELQQTRVEYVRVKEELLFAFHRNANLLRLQTLAVFEVRNATQTIADLHTALTDQQILARRIGSHLWDAISLNVELENETFQMHACHALALRAAIGKYDELVEVLRACATSAGEMMEACEESQLGAEANLRLLRGRTDELERMVERTERQLEVIGSDDRNLMRRMGEKVRGIWRGTISQHFRLLKRKMAFSSKSRMVLRPLDEQTKDMVKLPNREPTPSSVISSTSKPPTPPSSKLLPNEAVL